MLGMVFFVTIYNCRVILICKCTHRKEQISNMVGFEQIYKEYENTNNVCSFYAKYDDSERTAERFLLMRSLDKPDLINIYNKYVGDEELRGRIKDVLFVVYQTDITINQLLDYINGKRKELIKSRERELQGLDILLRDFPIEECGIRNDKVDDIIKGFVRDKSIKTIDEMQERLNNVILPKIKQYSLWSYYNQTANDLIELALLSNNKVVPTLRKIHDIDFFILSNGKVVPYDLKITHISDDYFEKLSKGIIASNNRMGDDFSIGNNDSELKLIREEYKRIRRTHNIPSTAGLKKEELIDILVSLGDPDVLAVIEGFRNRRSEYVEETASDLKKLEWWNYKYQGERLFCNNNRLFVFLSYKYRFIDGRPLKGKISQLKNLITLLLNSLDTDSESIHTIHYYYDKEPSLVGNYVANAISILYVE